MTQSHRGTPLAKHPARRLIAVAVASALSAAAQAGETIELDNGLKIDWTVGIGYTAAMRLKDPSAALVGAANPTGDDGNLNFKKNALVNNRVSVLAEANVRKDRSGVFVRASSFYDDVYHGRTDNPGGTLNTLQPASEFTSEARKWAGGRTRLLDAYGYTTVDLGEQASLNLRLGRHVVAWGEAYFFSTMATAQSPSDVAKAVIPGAEVKDIVLPVNQLSANLKLNQDWSFGGYAQFESKKSEMPPVGFYLWGSDLLGPGAGCVQVMSPYGCVFGARTGDEKAKSSGQWGVNTRYRVSDSDEIALYYFNYHDRTGVPVFTVSDAAVFSANPLTFAASYRVKYFEDIKVAGISYSTRLGEWQVSAEGSYKKGMPVLVNTGPFPTPTRANVSQFTLSTVKLFGALPFADGANLVGEITHSRISGVSPATLATSGTAAGEAAFLGNTPGYSAFCPTLGICGNYSQLNASNSARATAIAITATLNYTGVMAGLDMDVPIVFTQGLSGSNPTTMAGLASHKDGRLSVGLDFKYLGNLGLGLKYTKYLGSAKPDGLRDSVPYADRDFISASLKYSF